MWKRLGQCFDLTALHRLPNHASVITFCFPCLIYIFMMVFKKEIITKSVLTWLKNNNNWYFLLTSRNALCILVVLIASTSDI